MNGSKKWYKSKTFWFGVVAALITLFETVAAGYGYTGVVPDDWQQYLVVAVPIVTALLRLITKQPLTR